MEISGKIAGLSTDCETGELTISFRTSCAAQIKAEYDHLKDLPKLRIKAVKWTEKRSLDANAYFHVLVGKIADAMTISKAKAKNLMICQYGQPERLDDQSELVYKTNAPIEYMEEQEAVHARWIGMKEENGKEVNFYKIYRGSHTYDTKEMSYLIDGTVAEAKEHGIETMTPDELERMKQSWQIREKAL